MQKIEFIRYVIILVLILLNGIFSGTEMAIVSINKTKLKILVEKEDKRAILLDKILENPSKLLSTIQITVTISGFLASAFSAVGISEILEEYLEILKIPYAKEISIILITIILSYITLVLGELVPKRIGLRYADKIALKMVKIIHTLSIILSPFISILTVSTNLLLKIFRVDVDNNKEDISKEELKLIFDNTDDIIEENEKHMIKKVIEFDEKSAREIMKPRTSIFAIEQNEDINNLLNDKEFIKYSRIPVYDEELDNIVGILHVKDILSKAYLMGFDKINIKDIIKPAYFVPESVSINSLFKTMKTTNKHFTILVDEYGGVSGIVTLEDLLEEVVGNISDEYDIDDDKRIIKLSDKKYIVNCEISLNDLNEALKINLNSEYYDSLNGLLIEKLGFIPQDNQRIPDLKINNINFKFNKVKNKKIEKVIIEILK